MSAEVTLERNGRMVRYRPVTIANNWAKSEFEYFSTVTQEWRKAINWNTRERLFVLATTGIDIFRHNATTLAKDAV